MNFFLHDVFLNVTAARLVDPELYGLLRCADILKTYVTPVILCCSLIFNVICVAGVVSPPLNHFSTSVYVVVICVADITYTTGVFFTWITAPPDPWINIYGGCQALVALIQVAGFMSLWSMVAGVTDVSIRCIRLTCFANIKCNRSMATSLLVLVLILSAVTYLNLSLLYGVQYYPGGHMICQPLPQNSATIQLLANMDIALNFILPYMVQIALIPICFFKLRALDTYLSRRKPDVTLYGAEIENDNSETPELVSELTSYTLLNQERPTSQPPVNSDDISQRDVLRSLCRTLLIYSSIAVIITLPSHVFKLVMIAIYKFTMVDGSQASRLFTIRQILLYLLLFRCVFIFPVFLCSNVYFRQCIVHKGVKLFGGILERICQQRSAPLTGGIEVSVNKNRTLECLAVTRV